MTIKELRISRKLTQAKFGELLGLGRSELSRMENGLKKIGDQTADKIWEVFGVEVEGGEEAKPTKKAKPEKPEIYIQSSLGGNIRPEEIAAKMPAGTETCYVRVDQNLIWWVKDGETGAVKIWD